jgi:hypothetical protein
MRADDKLVRQHIAGTINTGWKLEVNRTSDARNENREIDVRVLFARKIFRRFLAVAKLLKLMVARDGIEPPTPAFSGPRSTN